MAQNFSFFVEDATTLISLHPNSWLEIKSFISQDNLIAESIFKVFDDDNSGTFTFEEYYQVGCQPGIWGTVLDTLYRIHCIRAILSFTQADNVGVLNTPEEKLGWIFTAFDADGGGSIDVEEIRLVVSQIGGFADWPDSDVPKQKSGKFPC